MLRDEKDKESWPNDEQPIHRVGENLKEMCGSL